MSVSMIYSTISCALIGNESNNIIATSLKVGKTIFFLKLNPNMILKKSETMGATWFPNQKMCFFKKEPPKFIIKLYRI